MRRALDGVALSVRDHAAWPDDHVKEDMHPDASVGTDSPPIRMDKHGHN